MRVVFKYVGIIGVGLYVYIKSKFIKYIVIGGMYLYDFV